MRIGRNLSQAGFRVVVYTLHQPADYLFRDPSHEGMKVVHLSDQEFLLEPYRREGHSELFATEGTRITALQLHNAVEAEKQNCSGARHVMISFYASGTGFLAQMAATGLRIPHIVAVRGTDFELDVFGAKQHPRLRTAIEGATQVVTTNQEQADALSAIFRVRRPIRTIHNALPDSEARPFWEWQAAATVRLISDCGFSGRKATHLLLRAVASLLDRGLPASLTVLGSVFWLESQAYWEESKAWYELRYPDRFSFPGQIRHEELDRYLLSAHIYCSASLAEGSSMSRIRALTLGIPIVTTANGGLPGLVAGCGHVRLCRAGDLDALTNELQAMVAAIQSETVQPDRSCVERWRLHFHVDRERKEWISAIEAALAAQGERV